MLPKHLLILDVDETLVFAEEKPLARAADFHVGPFHVYRRPYLADFISTVFQWFDVAVWSSASSAYVYGIVENVFGVPNPLQFVWTCDRCTRRYDEELGEHFYAKNLSKLRKLGFQLQRILMIDDSPEKLARH